MPRNARKREEMPHSGTLIVIATLIAIIAAGIYFGGAPIRKAKNLEQRVNDQFLWADEYTPLLDGSIPPGRVEAFLRVREAVLPHCGEFHGILDELLGLEELEMDEQMPAAEKASKSIRGLTRIFSAGPKFLAFSEARNSALLAEHMGLGEYMHIYLVAYWEQIAMEATGDYAAMKEAYVSPRTCKEYASILGNQLAGVEARDDQVSVETIAALQREIEALKDGSQLSPWPDGPPASTQVSLAPYREQIARSYCSGIVKIELLQKNRGFQFEG